MEEEEEEEEEEKEKVAFVVCLAGSRLFDRLELGAEMLLLLRPSPNCSENESFLLVSYFGIVRYRSN